MRPASQAHGVKLSAVIYPACVCGRPMIEHAAVSDTGICNGYVPCKPIRDMGLRSYTVPKGWPLSVRLICLVCWCVEYYAKRLREITEPTN